MSPPRNAIQFKLPAGYIWFLRFIVILGLGAAALPVVAVVSRDGPAEVGLALAISLIAGGFAACSWSAQARAREVIAVDDSGIWRLRPMSDPLFIAWRDVGIVKADDFMRRLVLSDHSRSCSFSLEYQLIDFEYLRDYIIRHTPAITRYNPTQGSVFHQGWSNKLFWMICFVAMVAVAREQAGGDLNSFVGLLIFAGLGLAFLRDPLSLSIAADRIVIRYPGWRREIQFRDIRSVTLSDLSNRMNTAVVIAARGQKLLKLYRFREGSLALLQALEGSLGAASSR